ncbi:MAG: carboxypeptidase regulatory-like domain-containing protein [Gammaproteobacteria bacterium]|nr:carboxypeptidase regulatory-like domain-containing protein [Gammaproteobacteria bacterium]
MRSFQILALSLAALLLSACGDTETSNQSATTTAPAASAPQAATATNQTNDNISGAVTSSNGPEAGVWVIAETNDLATLYSKTVVTDDQGRYLIPDLPAASYEVFVRGYGLVDSARIEASPGQNLDLVALIAPDAAAAAEYYPAGYWYSLLEIPEAHEFPGTGQDGNGIAAGILTQDDYIRRVTNGGCVVCHQMGNAATRTIPDMFANLETSFDQWNRRVRSGQAGAFMTNTLAGMGDKRTLEMYADWTDRIAAGELPPAPARPQGLERNVVITQWDWADPTAYLHDLVSTDRRDPTVNAYGKIYGALENSHDYLPVLDPVTHSLDQIAVFPEDPDYEGEAQPVMASSPFWGDEPIWDSATTVHNPMMDSDGRVWITSRARAPGNVPAFCQAGSDHPSAQAFPLGGSGRHLGVYDPRSDVYTPINTCFGTHHLMFAEDADNTLWTSGGGQVVGWLNTREFLTTGDAVAAQGWTPFILDTNGNGQRDDYVEPDAPVDPAKDKRINSGLYAVAPAPDGSVWGSNLNYPGAIVRVMPGSDPSTTALTEYYELPINPDGSAIEGFSPRGMDIDRNGIAWVALASGHMGRFDRSQCRGPLTGPMATGQHCPEGWTFFAEPLPQFKNIQQSGSSEGSYYTWVDQFDTLGLGTNTPINTGNQSGSLLVLNDGEWVRLTVPYPLGFYTKWLDGRIDDANAGWKGRGVWATISSRAPFHMETGAGTTSKVYHFQMRPGPTAD